ncbi:MAG: hypothetical protein M3O61_03680, partial [Gemmatimonadota bacterium]|nr:hypothetical protein [Gemmatimonadota bacterium]
SWCCITSVSAVVGSHYLLFSTQIFPLLFENVSGPIIVSVVPLNEPVLITAVAPHVNVTVVPDMIKIPELVDSCDVTLPKIEKAP